ncbi:MAG: TraR/DksA family transcriptional regulator [Candidatus Binatia bacterium]
MDKKTRMTLEKELIRKQEMIVKDLVATQRGLDSFAEERETELYEAAQEELMARVLRQLGGRAKQQLDEIEAALAKIADGEYGICAECEEDIPVARLRVMPAAEYCVPCASKREAEAANGTEERYSAGKLTTNEELLESEEA